MQSIESQEVQMQINVPSAMMTGLQLMISSANLLLIVALAEKYGFSAEEAAREMCVSVVTCEKKRVQKKSVLKEKVVKEKVQKEKPSIPFPFSGARIAGCCGAVRSYSRLYSQCLTKTEGEYCTSCANYMTKHGKLEYGSIDERIAQRDQGTPFCDAKGKPAVPYFTVMKKLGLTEEQVLAEVQKFEIPFTTDHFDEPESKRGRPKKSSDESSASSVEKKRGRPKKSEKVVHVETTEDLFATLIKQTKKEQSECDTMSSHDTDVSDMSDEEEEEEEEETPVHVPVAAKKEKVVKEKKEPKEKVVKEVREKVVKAPKEPKVVKEKVVKAPKEPKVVKEKVVKAPKEKVVKTPKEKTAAKKTPEPVTEESDNEEEEEEEETVVKKFVHEGTQYLRSPKNLVYNMKQHLVGTWNETTEQIDTCELESDEECDEDEDEEDDASV